ncbi:hypothetical protein D3C81_1661800 [compost metagenome]
MANPAHGRRDHVSADYRGDNRSVAESPARYVSGAPRSVVAIACSGASWNAGMSAGQDENIGHRMHWKRDV